MKRIPWFFVLAVLLLMGFGVAWALDLREYVSVLSGTPVPGVPVEEALVGGTFYVLAWFGTVLVVPVLVLAAALAEIPRVVEGRGRVSGE